MNASATSSRHLTWPAQRFYWALLDASVIPRTIINRAPDSEQLGYLFESALPVSIDCVHAVYIPLGGKRFLACGVEHDRLSAHIAPETLTLNPDSIPPQIAREHDIEATSINLLTGPHEPRAVRRQRGRFIIETGALAALLLLALVLGVERRIQSLDGASALIEGDKVAIYERLYDHASASVQPPSVRLLAELRQLQRTRAGSITAADFDQPHAAFTLASLLANWPDEHQIRTESISVTPTSITLVGLLPSAPEAQAFISAFAPPQQWEAGQPQISSVSGGVRLTWRLARRPARADAQAAQANTEGSGL